MELLKRVKQEYWNLIFIAAIAVLLFWNFTLNDKVDYLEHGFRLVAPLEMEIVALESEIKELKLHRHAAPKVSVKSTCHTHGYSATSYSLSDNTWGPTLWPNFEYAHTDRACP